VPLPVLAAGGIIWSAGLAWCGIRLRAATGIRDHFLRDPESPTIVAAAGLCLARDENA